MKQLKDFTNWKDMIGEVVWGDCLEGMKMIPDKSIDLVLTDPPYGLAGRITNGGGWANDKPKNGYSWDQSRPSQKSFDEIFRISRSQVIFGGNYFADLLPISRCWIVWDKVTKGFTAVTNELAWTSFDSKIEIFSRPFGLDQGFMSKTQFGNVHPTQKPVEFMRWILENYSKEGDLVCDPFMGSWTTARACKDLGRRFIGFELEEKYCRVGEERLRQENLF